MPDQALAKMMPAPPGSSLRHSVGKLRQSFLGSAVIAALSIASLLGLWELLAWAYDVPRWLFPRPSDFLGRLVTDWRMITGHAVATSLAILKGFGFGVLVAIPLGLSIASVPALERGLYPVIVFLNIMPKMVIGPILIIWFGIGPIVGVLIVFLMCFFPVLVDAISGFKSIDTRLFYISRSMGATPTQSFLKFRLPAAMPHIFSGMKIGVVKAVEGAIVAEFITSNEGIGFMIMEASAYMDVSLIFAGLIAAAIVALIFNGTMAIAGKTLMPWSTTTH